MGATQEAAVRDMLTALVCAAGPEDLDRIADRFARDARWTLYMPDGPTVVGREAIRSELQRQATTWRRLETQPLLMASSDDMVMAERADRIQLDGRVIEQRAAGVFSLDAEGRISAWRDYFDVLDVAAQAGVSPDGLSGLEACPPGPGLDRSPPVPEATDGFGLAAALHAPRGPEEALIEAFCQAWGDGTPASRPDVDRIVSMMAPDAEWLLWTPGGPLIRGREALRTEINRQIAYSGHNRCNTVHAVSNPRLVIHERSDWAVLLGRPCPHQMVAVYELDQDGLITAWREYINMADLDRKRGARAETAHLGI